MGLHGSGVWGQSSANTKGHKRVRCPVCGKVEVVGSRSHAHLHLRGPDGRYYIARCVHQCPKCGKMHYYMCKCPDCGYDALEVGGP